MSRQPMISELTQGWLVVVVRTGMEKRVIRDLNARASKLGMTIQVREGLDRGYILARLPVDESSRDELLKARGVHGLLGGKNPIEIADSEVESAVAEGHLEATRTRIRVHFGKL
jgi:transcription antitermination factor NusG